MRTRPKNSDLHPSHQYFEDLEREWHKRSFELRDMVLKAQNKTGADPKELERLIEEEKRAAKTAAAMASLLQSQQGGFMERSICGGGCAIDITIMPAQNGNIFLRLEDRAGVHTENEERLINEVFVHLDTGQASRVAYALLSLAYRKTIPHTYEYEHKKRG